MKEATRRLVRRLPAPVRRAAQRLVDSPYWQRRLRRVRWGNLRRLEPFSPGWGSKRGTVVDRYYIDRFFADNAHLITGRVLEVGDPRYTSQFGRSVTSIDILDIDPRNGLATIVADLAEPDSLPREAFDCAVVPQTLVSVSDPFAAAANIWQSVAPGGAALITTPAIAHVDHAACDVDRWHLTAAGLEQVLGRSCPRGSVTVRAFGNPLVAVAFLHGLAAEDLQHDELEANDPLYPIVAAAVALKPPE